MISENKMKAKVTSCRSVEIAMSIDEAQKFLKLDRSNEDRIINEFHVHQALDKIRTQIMRYATKTREG